MRFACDNCGAQYMIADEKIGPRGVKVKCKKCEDMIVVRPPEVADDEGVDAGGEFGSDDNAAAAGGGESQGQASMGGAFDAVFGAESAQQSPEAPVDDAGASFPDSGDSQIPGAAGFGGGLGAEPGVHDSDDGSTAGSQVDEQQTGSPVDSFGFGMARGAGEETESGESSFEPGGSEGVMPGSAGFDTAAAGGLNPGGQTFGFEAEGSTGGETDFAIGSLDRQPDPEPESESRPAGEKEWYVAIDDSQVGPIDLAEVEERWSSRELDEDSLAWKTGMADWLAIADIPELAYLITEKPQRAAATSSGFGSAPVSGGASPSASSVGSASFGGGGDGAPVDWKPSAASALSSLVQDEIQSKPEPDVPAGRAPGPALEGMPSFGASDVFGGAGGAGSSPTPDAFAPPTSSPVGDGGGGWTIPEPKRSGGNTGLVVALVLLVVFLLGAGGGAFYWFVVRPGAAPTTAQPTQAPPTELAESGKTNDAPTPAGTEPDPAEDAENKGEAPADEDEEDPKEEQDSKDESKAKSKTKADIKDPRRSTSKPKARSRARATTSPKREKIDDVFDAPKAKANLTKEDIFSGVKKNGGKLKPCLTAALSKGEVLPGRYKFVLDWRIQPSGKTTGGKLKGPGEVMKTSLPGCFARVMNTWRFPPSQSGAPVSNFPLPITVR